MYCPDKLGNAALEPDQLYIERIQEQLQEIAIQKQIALDTEDYTTADQIRNKMNILQQQLNRLEDQFSTDMLQNCVTNWQSELVAYLVDNITNQTDVSTN